MVARLELVNDENKQRVSNCQAASTAAFFFNRELGFLFVGLRTWYFGAENWQKRNMCVGHHDTKQARPTPTPARSAKSSKVMNVQETARREVELSSSYLKGNSKPGLNRSHRPLLCNRQNVCTYIYSMLAI